MAEIRRTENGKFADGQTGNPRGRPRKRKIDPKLPAGRRDVITRVADRIVEVKIDRKAERMSIYEANVLQLGLSGAKGNRVAALKFIELAMTTSITDLTTRLSNRMIIDHMNAIDEQNEQLRQQAGQKSGVLVLPPMDFQALQDRRLDDRGAEEILGRHRSAGDESAD